MTANCTETALWRFGRLYTREGGFKWILKGFSTP